MTKKQFNAWVKQQWADYTGIATEEVYKTNARVYVGSGPEKNFIDRHCGRLGMNNFQSIHDPSKRYDHAATALLCERLFAW